MFAITALTLKIILIYWYYIGCIRAGYDGSHSIALHNHGVDFGSGSLLRGLSFGGFGISRIQRFGYGHYSLSTIKMIPNEGFDSK